MRVAIVSDWMLPAGGAETYIISLRDALRDAGHEVALLTCGPSPEASAEYAVESRADFLSQVGGQIAHPRARRIVQQMVTAFRPDVAIVGHFAYHLSPYALQPLEGLPHAIYLMDYKSICPLGTKRLPNHTRCHETAGAVCIRERCVSVPHWLRDQPRYALIRERLSRATMLLTPSVAMRHRLAADGVSCTVLPQPVAAPSAGYVRARSAAPQFLYVGRLVEEKGVLTLLSAFAQMRAQDPDAELRVVGDGVLRGRVERAARETKGITVLGARAFADVEHEMAQAWAVVMPSLWEEPYGLVALEAIVRGVPVIASDIGGLAENVQHGVTGLLCAPGDVDALTNAMREIVDGSARVAHGVATEHVLAMQRASSPAQHVEALLRGFGAP